MICILVSVTESDKSNKRLPTMLKGIQRDKTLEMSFKLFYLVKK